VEVESSRHPNPVTPGANKAHILGKKNNAVRRVANLGKIEVGTYLCHLKNTLEAHQKLATLSSNSPRAKGKILMIGWRRWVNVGVGGQLSGRMNGMKRMTKERMVIAPMRMRWIRLQG
jgi:hypothetical protein